MLPTAAAFVAYAATGERSFVFYVREAAAGQSRLQDLGDLPERASWLHVSGSAIALGATLADVVTDAARRVRAAGGKVSVEPEHSGAKRSSVTTVEAGSSAYCSSRRSFPQPRWSPLWFLRLR